MSPVIFDDRWIASHGIGRVARHWAAMRPGWTRIGPGPNPASMFDPLWLGRRLEDEEGVFLSPSFNGPLRARRPFFLTIHDVCYIDMAPITGWARKLYYETIVRDRAHAAIGVFTVSEFSKSRLCDTFRLPSDQVHLAPPGVGSPFTTHGPKAKRERPYVLCVSNPSPHKNEQRTIDAFASSALARTHELVLTGAPRPLKVTDRALQLSFTGVVTDHELAELYRGAHMLVFASLYEGFGLPAAEAMACGTPVVCSGGGALEEITAGAARLVDPGSTSSIREGLEEIASDADLAGALRRAGLRRAGSISWPAGLRVVDRALAIASEDHGLARAT